GRSERHDAHDGVPGLDRGADDGPQRDHGQGRPAAGALHQSRPLSQRIDGAQYRRSPGVEMIDFATVLEERRAQAAGLGRRLLHIALLSACGLMLELVLIRWLDAQVRPLAYVKNLALIAAFLGLGIGYAT